eukprot:CFRG8666
MSSFPFYSVPICWVLTMAPHVYKTYLLDIPNHYTTGRANLKDYEGKVAKDQYALCQRLACAHTNSYEIFGMYTGGVSACIATNVPIEQVTLLCQSFIVARIAFNVVYAMKPFAGGVVRTFTFASSMACIFMLWAAAAVNYQ